MRRYWRWLAAALLCPVILASGLTVRLFVRPSLPPPPARVDAIIELGGPGDRDATALALAREHRAPLLIQSTVPGDTAEGRCLPPVPGVTIDCFHAEPNTTRGEARYIGRVGAQRGWTSVILVTSPDHAWRARLRVQRCFPGEVYVVTSPLPWWEWFRAVPYQWAATAKAILVERDC